MKLVAAVLALVGAALGIFGFLLLAAVISVLMQGKPLDVPSTLIALILLGIATFALASAWRRWRREP